MKEIEDLPFEKTFERNGRQMILFCDIDRGGVQLEDEETGNSVFLTIDDEGNIIVSANKTHPLCRIEVGEVELGDSHGYDEVNLKAYLGHEGAIDGDVIEGEATETGNKLLSE